MNQSDLSQQNAVFHGTGGVSANNRSLGFQPAFRNKETGLVYASRFADGRLAPIHLMDGLPEELVVARTGAGRVVSIKTSVQAGFTLNGNFYDRGQAARYLRARC